MAGVTKAANVVATIRGIPRWSKGNERNRDSRIATPSPRVGPAELLLRDGRLSAQLHVEAAFLVAAVGLDRDLVADLLAHDRLAEVLRLRDGLAVDLDDEVAAEQVALPVDHDLARPCLHLGAGRAAALVDSHDEQSALGREVEELRDLLVDLLRAHADERMLDAALLDQLRDDVADRVHRHREPDPDVAACAGVPGCDRGVDADHGAVRRDQWAA